MENELTVSTVEIIVSGVGGLLTAVAGLAVKLLHDTLKIQAASQTEFLEFLRHREEASDRVLEANTSAINDVGRCVAKIETHLGKGIP